MRCVKHRLSRWHSILHGAPYSIAPEYQTKVPMIMWFSKEWIKNEPFDLNCVRENAKTYSHDNYFHSVIEMMDMDLSLSVYQKELDILNQCRK